MTVGPIIVPETVEPESKVLPGQDGYLFLTNDTNQVQSQIEGAYVLPKRQIWATAAIHAARSALCTLSGARYDHIVIPDREVVLRRHLPDPTIFERLGPRPVKQYMLEGAPGLHRFFYNEAVLAEDLDPPSFFKRDTHWTFDGAFRYLRAIIPSMDIDPALISVQGATVVPYDNPGDLGSKIGAPPEPSFLRVQPKPSLKPVFDNELSNVGRLRLFVNEERPADERTLVLHDSFGEWLALLLPMTSHTTCFVHMPDFDELFVRRFRPSRVICVQIERFFIRQPYNGIDLFEAIAEFGSKKEAKMTEIPHDIMALLQPGT
jgi:alginate O-acetyltransferase complex protein AlgJ